jgi:hypothetical protein
MEKELEGTERAFPQKFERTMEDGTRATTIRYGMTLRDYFAAKAMQGLLAGWTHGVPETDLLAKTSYKFADSMLEARK